MSLRRMMLARSIESIGLIELAFKPVKRLNNRLAIELGGQRRVGGGPLRCQPGSQLRGSGQRRGPASSRAPTGWRIRKSACLILHLKGKPPRPIRTGPMSGAVA